MRKLLPQDAYKGLADLVHLVVLLKLISLQQRSIPAVRTDVDHAVPEFDEGASLHRKIKVSNIVEDEVHQLFVVGLSDVLDKGLRLERHARLVRRKTVFREAEVEE